MEMECMVANTPGDCALFGRRGCLVSLAFYAKVHDMIAADGAVIDNNIPSPQCYGIPLFDLKAFPANEVLGLSLGFCFLLGGHVVVLDIIEIHVSVRHCYEIVVR